MAHLLRAPFAPSLLERLFFRYQADRPGARARGVRAWAHDQADLRDDWVMIAQLESLVAFREARAEPAEPAARTTSA
jgi:hypothetical protein